MFCAFYTHTHTEWAATENIEMNLLKHRGQINSA